MTDSFRARGVQHIGGAQLRLRGPARTDGNIIVRLPPTQLHLRGPAATAGNINVTVPSGATFWDTIDSANVADAAKTDVTTAINNYLASLPNGSTVVWKPGVYRIDGVLLHQQRLNFTHIGTGITLRRPYIGTITDGVITGGTNFHSASALFTSRITGATIASAGTVIPANTTVTYVGPHDLTLSNTSTNIAVQQAYINAELNMPTNWPFWRLNLGSGFVIRGFTARGGNLFGGTTDPAYDARFEAHHFVNISGADNVEIDSVDVADIYGDFVYASTYLGSGSNLAVNSWVHDSVFARNGRQNCSLQGVSGFRWGPNNDSRNVRRAMFDFEPAGTLQTNAAVEIDHNFFGVHRLLFIAASGGTRACAQGDVYVHDNTSTDGFEIEWWGEPWVNAATTAALPTCTYSAGTLTATANGVLPTQDGVTLSTATGNNRLLVKNQVLTQHDGPYRITDMGSGSTPWIMVRADDFNSAAELVDGRYVYVMAGTASANSGYRVHPTISPPLVGTTPLPWTHMSGTGIGTGPWARNRGPMRFDNNVTTYSVGNSAAAAQTYKYIEGVEILTNTQPLQDRFPTMAVADCQVCTGVNVSGNDTGGVGDQVHIHP